MLSSESQLEPPFDPARPIHALQESLGELVKAASVEAVYGEPVRNGDTVVIPSAEVLGMTAMGMGYGWGQGTDKEQENQGSGAGGGGGGFGRVLSRPVAAVILSPDGVRVEPIVDVTKVALAALTAGGFMIGMLMRMQSARGVRQAIEGD
jgi:uncharacterized spore protein YtfJ